MRMNPSGQRQKELAATITASDSGGFYAVASDGLVDRDGEVIAPRALWWTGETLPVGIDHGGSAKDVIARARPIYVGEELHIDATFGSSPEAQVVRTKVQEGILTDLSIVFFAARDGWRDVDGVRTLMNGELLGVDIVRIPSNSRARVLSVRSHNPAASHPLVMEARKKALLALVDVELSQARLVLKQARSDESPTDQVRRFLRSL